MYIADIRGEADKMLNIKEEWAECLTKELDNYDNE